MTCVLTWLQAGATFRKASVFISTSLPTLTPQLYSCLLLGDCDHVDRGLWRHHRKQHRGDGRRNLHHHRRRRNVSARRDIPT